MQIESSTAFCKVPPGYAFCKYGIVPHFANIRAAGTAFCNFPQINKSISAEKKVPYSYSYGLPARKSLTGTVPVPVLRAKRPKRSLF